MNGIGPPLVTPFTQEGNIDHAALRDLVDWIEQRGVDFLVPCGSNSEAELMTADERLSVIETVVESANVPVLAGTGSPGYQETLRATEDAAAAGADAALVVTPFYYDHDQSALAKYYRRLADETSIPIYLYSVPAYTDIILEPATVGELATHPNIAGIKDSSGNISEFIRTVRRTKDADFDPMIGSGGVFAQALSAGAKGGVLALANIAPEATAAIYKRHAQDPTAAKELNGDFVELNRAITTDYGVPGLKYAMRTRDAPAGHQRHPHQPPTDEATKHLDSLLRIVEDATM